MELVLLHQGLFLLHNNIFDDEDVTMAVAQTLIKIKEEKAKAKGVAIKDVEDSSRPIRSITTLQPLPTIDPKDKGKGVLVEEEPEKPEKVKRRESRLDCGYIVPNEDETVDPALLSVKYHIVDWESQNLRSVDMEDIHVYKIIRADRNTNYHKTFSSMLRKFDRQDLMDLHTLVMKRVNVAGIKVTTAERLRLLKEFLLSKENG
ncbi:hypothetical protein Tco_0158042 [Tanacetum coccineum]